MGHFSTANSTFRAASGAPGRISGARAPWRLAPGTRAARVKTVLEEAIRAVPIMAAS